MARLFRILLSQIKNSINKKKSKISTLNELNTVEIHHFDNGLKLRFKFVILYLFILIKFTLKRFLTKNFK